MLGSGKSRMSKKAVLTARTDETRTPLSTARTEEGTFSSDRQASPREERGQVRKTVMTTAMGHAPHHEEDYAKTLADFAFRVTTIVKLQARVRGRQTRAHYRMVAVVTQIQRTWRNYKFRRLASRFVGEMRTAIKKVQAHWRMHRERNPFLLKRLATVLIQGHVRDWIHTKQVSLTFAANARGMRLRKELGEMPVYSMLDGLVGPTFLKNLSTKDARNNDLIDTEMAKKNKKKDWVHQSLGVMEPVESAVKDRARLDFHLDALWKEEEQQLAMEPLHNALRRIEEYQASEDAWKTWHLRQLKLNDKGLERRMQQEKEASNIQASEARRKEHFGEHYQQHCIFGKAMSRQVERARACEREERYSYTKVQYDEPDSDDEEEAAMALRHKNEQALALSRGATTTRWSEPSNVLADLRDRLQVLNSIPEEVRHAGTMPGCGAQAILQCGAAYAIPEPAVRKVSTINRSDRMAKKTFKSLSMKAKNDV